MLAANIYAQHKMIHGLEQFYTVTQGKVTQFIQHNPFTAPEKYLLTPEGIILQSSIGINTQNSSPSLKSSARENEFFRWLKRMNKRAIKD